jgi:hypothetical protein
MTAQQLELDIQTFAALLVASVTADPVVQQQTLGDRPLKIRVGISAAGVEPVALESAIMPAFHKSFCQVWPVNAVGGLDPQSVALAADGQSVIFDLVFFSLPA